MAIKIDGLTCRQSFRGTENGEKWPRKRRFDPLDEQGALRTIDQRVPRVNTRLGDTNL